MIVLRKAAAKAYKANYALFGGVQNGEKWWWRSYVCVCERVPWLISLPIALTLFLFAFQ